MMKKLMLTFILALPFGLNYAFAMQQQVQQQKQKTRVRTTIVEDDATQEEEQNDDTPQIVEQEEPAANVETIQTTQQPEEHVHDGNCTCTPHIIETSQKQVITPDTLPLPITPSVENPPSADYLNRLGTFITGAINSGINWFNAIPEVPQHTCECPRGHIPCTEYCRCPGSYIGCFATGCFHNGKNHNHIFKCHICKRIMSHDEVREAFSDPRRLPHPYRLR